MAVIEMARASGLALVKGKKRIREATSFGTGQLIKAALDKGCRQIVLGVGGTASSDGGAGALQALGLKYIDKEGLPVSPQPKDLIRIHGIDRTTFDNRLRKTKITVLCDVKNPLLGPKGSARVFGPQKGASPQDVVFLERLLARWSRFAKQQVKNRPGAGAAGALAFGLAGFAGARLVEGTPFIIKELGWKSRACTSDWIITGEGRVDQSSFSGKVIGTILKNRFKAKVFVVCGNTSLPQSFLRRKGISRTVKMGSEGLRNPKKTCKNASLKLIRQLKYTDC